MKYLLLLLIFITSLTHASTLILSERHTGFLLVSAEDDSIKIFKCPQSVLSSFMNAADEMQPHLCGPSVEEVSFDELEAISLAIERGYIGTTRNTFSLPLILLTAGTVVTLYSQSWPVLIVGGLLSGSGLGQGLRNLVLYHYDSPQTVQTLKNELENMELTVLETDRFLESLRKAKRAFAKLPDNLKEQLFAQSQISLQRL